MITIQEAKENELIQEEILKSIPTKCKCGSKLEFTESLQELVCTNPKCPYSVAKRLNNMTRQLGITSFDESVCNELSVKFNFTTPFQVFLIKQLQDNNIKVDIIDFNKKVKEIEEVKKRKIELWKIVKYANIRYISTIAEKLFSCYDSIEKAYDDIEKGQVAFIAEKLGIKNDEPSVISILIYNELIKHKEELIFAETQLTPIKHNSDPLRIAIAGNIPGFLNKTDYLNMLNIRYYEKIRFVLDSNVTDETHILVVDTETTSTKYRTAKRINEKYISKGIHDEEFTLDEVGKFVGAKDLMAIGEHIIICNGADLIKRLDKVYL